MPSKGKKKGGGANQKKKGNHNNAAPPSSSSAAANSSSKSSMNLKGEIPNFSELSAIRPSSDHNSNPTLYSKYKAATVRFLDYMRENSSERDNGEFTVNSLFNAVNFMTETNHILNPVALRDLTISIRLRSRVAKSAFGGRDAGHKYFLQALIYCWSILNSLPKKEADNNAVHHEGYDGNRFDILEMDEDDVTEDEENFPKCPVQQPDPLDKPRTIKEILASEDRADAIMFLLTLDELMEFVAKFCIQQTESIQYARKDVSHSFMIRNLMETAVTTNMAIQQVQQLEMELQAHHEHLTTPYRLLSMVIMPDMTLDIMSIMREPAAKKCNKRDVSSFLGDCMECYFRNVSDKFNKSGTIVRDFCATYQVDSFGRSEMEKIFLAIEMIVKLEVPFMLEKDENYDWMQRVARLSGMPGKSHQWLNKLNSIGGGRSIHHTIRLLQMFGSLIGSTPRDVRLEPKRGFFGPSPWRAGTSETTHGDLDELLMSDIVPNWVTMCRHGILGRAKLPYENKVCPFFVSVRAYVARRETGVLVFGFRSPCHVD